MEKLALSIGGKKITVPGGVPTEGTNTLSSVLVVAFDVLITLAILLTVVYLIWGGFDWIMSEGDKTKVAQARTKISFAIIGLVVIFLAFFIIKTLIGIFLGHTGFIPCPHGVPGRISPC